MGKTGKKQGGIGIDGRSLRGGSGGIATYVGNLIKRIPLLEVIDHHWPVNNLLWNCLRVPFEAYRRGWCLYHAPAYTLPLLKPCPVVLTVHDISYLVCSEWYPYHLGFLRRASYRLAIKLADRIIVPSRFTGEEICRIFPERASAVRQIALGVSEEFEPDSESGEAVRHELGLPSGFLLHVGDIHLRRNVDKVVEAGRSLGAPVVLVGRKLDQSPVDLRGTYRFENLPLSSLRGLYNAASVLVYPSVYEGFGLPVLEAMACGCPVVAAARASIPEVCGDAAILVEPEVDQLVNGIQEVDSKRKELISRGIERARGFSWERTARDTEAVYRELMSKPGLRGSAGKLV